jgi:hypothetical protein
MEERSELIQSLYHLGLSHKDILVALSVHGYILSERHLRRILASLSLWRRRGYSDLADVVRFVQAELNASGCLHGYRWMYQKCLQAGLRVRRDDIRIILTHLDPEGSAFRYVTISNCQNICSLL